LAIPVAYDLTYADSGGGLNGTGSAIWDADTFALSEFTWNFGATRTGGFTTSVLNSLGDFIWEVVTGDDVYLGAVAGQIGTSGSTTVFGYGTAGVQLDRVGRYMFDDAQYEALMGTIRVALRNTGGGVSVVEPASLAMFGFGLLGLAVARRRRRD
jgi:hypothetical protein